MNKKWRPESTPPPPPRRSGVAKKNGLSRKVIREAYSAEPNE